MGYIQLVCQLSAGHGLPGVETLAACYTAVERFDVSTVRDKIAAVSENAEETRHKFMVFATWETTERVRLMPVSYCLYDSSCKKQVFVQLILILPLVYCVH